MSCHRRPPGLDPAGTRVGSISILGQRLGVGRGHSEALRSQRVRAVSMLPAQADPARRPSRDGPRRRGGCRRGRRARSAVEPPGQGGVGRDRRRSSRTPGPAARSGPRRTGVYTGTSGRRRSGGSTRSATPGSGAGRDVRERGRHRMAHAAPGLSRSSSSTGRIMAPTSGRPLCEAGTAGSRCFDQSPGRPGPSVRHCAAAGDRRRGRPAG